MITQVQESLIPAATTAQQPINSTWPIRLWVVSTDSQSRGFRRTRPSYSSSHWPTPHAQPEFKTAATPHQIRPATMPTYPSQRQSPGAPHNSPRARRQAQHHGQNHSPNACLTSGSAYRLFNAHRRSLAKGNPNRMIRHGQQAVTRIHTKLCADMLTW